MPREGRGEGPKRVNVRVLELIDEASGSRIELEGEPLPVTPLEGGRDRRRAHRLSVPARGAQAQS